MTTKGANTAICIAIDREIWFIKAEKLPGTNET